MTTKNNEQERAEFEAWLRKHYDYDDLATFEIEFAFAAFQAGRAALQSQDREDALEKAKYALMIAQAHAPCPLYAETIEAIDHARHVEEEGE